VGRRRSSRALLRSAARGMAVTAGWALPLLLPPALSPAGTAVASWDDEPPAAGLLPSFPHPPNATPGGTTQYRGCRAHQCSTAGFPTVAAPVRWRQSSSQPSPAPFGTSSIWDQPILPLCGRRAPSPGVAALSFPRFLAAHPAGRMPRCIEQLETLPWRKGRRPDSELGSRVAAVRLSASFWPTLGSAAAQTPTMAAQNVATWRGITVFEGLSLCPATNTRMACKGFELPAQLPVQQNRSTAPALRWRFPCRGSRITAALK